MTRSQGVLSQKPVSDEISPDTSVPQPHDAAPGNVSREPGCIAISGEGDISVPLNPKPRRQTFATRKQRPVPATRAEADALYGVGRVTGPASGAQLYRLARLGCLELRAAGGEPLTRGRAHDWLLDALYDPDTGRLRDEPHEQAVRATPVQQTDVS